MDQVIQDYLDKYGVGSTTRDAVAATPKMFIAGDFTEGQACDTAAVLEPSTGAHLTDVLLGTEADVDAAVAAAHAAFESGPWSEMPPNERQNILLRLADLMEKHADTLAEIETIDNGKAIGPCKDFDVFGLSGPRAVHGGVVDQN